MNFDEFKGKRSQVALVAGQQVVDTVVEHEEFTQICDVCVDMVETMRALKMPSGVLIQAEPGMGKTLLLQTIKRKLSVATGNERPPVCLHIGLDSAVDTPKIAALVMLKLGYPMLPSRPNLENINRLVAIGLERIKPKALLIDETQHTCEGNRDITALAVTDWLKVRMDEFNLPIICAGTRKLERLQVINPQFTSRASTSLVLTPFELGGAWRQLLGAFSAAVVVVNLDILVGPIGKKVHQATQGNFRKLKKLLTFASMYAADRPDKKVNLNDLALAYQDATGQAHGRSNPFVESHKNGL
jgi:hypothetical protein